MNPGITMVPEQSITSASPSSMLGATRAMRPVHQDVGFLEITHGGVEAEYHAAPRRMRRFRPSPSRSDGRAVCTVVAAVVAGAG